MANTTFLNLQCKKNLFIPVEDQEQLKKNLKCLFVSFHIRYF